MNILITGKTGFVGQNLCAYLGHAKNATIGGLNLRQAGWQNDIAADTGVIVHLAGKAHDLKNASDPGVYYQVNYELTRQVYDAFLASNAKKFIFISSVKAAADSVDGVLTEDGRSSPKTDYGKSKLQAEQYIQSLPLPEGKSWYILRPCMIHGPGNKGNLNLLYSFVSKGLPYPLASFENKRSFLSVENLCFIIQELIERDDIPQAIYNAADDEALSTNEVVSLLSEAIGKSPRLLHIPKGLISFMAKIGDALKLPLTTERLRKLTENYVVSNQKIKLALAKELPLTARDGILKTAASFTHS
jgi:nucleoside-diphosphate-sugar epimerase